MARNATPVQVPTPAIAAPPPSQLQEELDRRQALQEQFGVEDELEALKKKMGR